VLRRDPTRRDALYGRAVRDLVTMHRSLADGAPGTVVATRAFDEALLRWELAHFVEFGLDARGVLRSDAARTALDQAFDVLARDLAARPRGFVHRDYQSRNLMLDARGVTAGDHDALVMIDFQDALLGPRAYDLVALLRDSYQNFDETFVDAMVTRYADLAELLPDARASFRDEFDRLTVQRKLKDAGRFVFIERNKGDPSFLPYYAPSLARVRRALARLAGDPTLARISALLADALPEHFG
jgi:aminoglycoside/choline kinase family phosphotransferase